MSDISDAATAHVFVADYAAADASQKLNMLGANWQVTGPDPMTGNVPGHTVVALVEVPSRFVGQNAAITITLVDDTGAPVQLTGPNGEPQIMRLGQVVTINRAAVPNVPLPDDVPSRVQMLLNFPQGLPLATGRSYSWKLDIDGNTEPGWAALFYVAGPPPAPVLG